MDKRKVVELHPDLVITIQSAIDRMCNRVAQSVESKETGFTRHVSFMRYTIKKRCESYTNCREEDWCFLCASGQNGQLFRGTTCLDCKLLTADAAIKHKGLVTISNQSS